MLQILRIKNFALVHELTLELQPGFTAITGETGAGKSIILGALNLVLGARAERNLIRSGSESCLVEAVFHLGGNEPSISSFLSDNGFESDPGRELFLKRAFSSNGSNRQFINGSPCSLNTLAQLGDLLVDLHGPHEHQSLLHPSKQLALLDAFGGLNTDRRGMLPATTEAFAVFVAGYKQAQEDKLRLIIDEKAYWQQIDLLRFQVQEIDSARLRAAEDQSLEEEHKRASHAAQIIQSGHVALDLIAADEQSLLSQNALLGRRLQELRNLDSRCEDIARLQEEVAGLLQELQLKLSNYLERVEIDPDQFRKLEERMNCIQSLKRKYGSSIAEILSFADRARSQLLALEGRDQELKEINLKLAALEHAIGKAGVALSNRRLKVIPKFIKAVNQELSELGFERSSFDVSLTSKKWDPAGPTNLSGSGFDTIEFQFSPNQGEPLRPLRTIASSGEIARVMLALKTVLAKQDEIPVLIFDEVDANVGGETAQKIAEKMAQIAKKRQVLCITHLALIAACASSHFVVNKQLREGRTVSDVILLDDQERIMELARMLGGQTLPARKHAEALLEQGRLVYSSSSRSA